MSKISTSTLHCTHLNFSLSTGLLAQMLEHGGGHIVVISSLQGKIGLPFRSSCKQNALSHMHDDAGVACNL